MDGRAKMPRGEIAARLVFWCGTFLFLLYLFVKSWELSSGDPTLESRRIDFIAFWAAARLALAGRPLAAFDPAALAEAAGVDAGTVENLRWLYPPAFHALIAPLGLLPYWAAWVAFAIVSAAALALAADGPARPLPGGWRLVVVSPVTLIGCLAIGQTSLLWTAGLMAALWAIRQERRVAAGAWIALLTIKPQLGILVPVALLAARNWRTFAAASAIAAVVILGPTALFGVEYWRHFLADLDGTVARMERGYVLDRLVSTYGFLRAAGADHAPALAAQLMATVMLGAAVAWTWSRTALGTDLKFAVLCAAIPLATPYAYYYEMVLTLAAGVFLVRDGFGRGLLAKAWLFLIWLGPVPSLYLPGLATVALAAPPLIAGTLAIGLVRAWRPRAGTPGRHPLVPGASGRGAHRQVMR